MINQEIKRPEISFHTAELSDITEILTLLKAYQINTIAEEDKKDGFITADFTPDQMEALITQEDGCFVAKDQGRIVAFALSASWGFWSAWPIFQKMIEDLPSLTYQGYQLSIENSYQYGPVCVARDYRGTGVFQDLFAFALQQMSTRYPVMLSFINTINERSYAAHITKLGLDVIQQFEFNGNTYHEMACLTQSVPEEGALL